MRIPAERIAIVKLGAIGDVVNSLPFVNRLRDGLPRARIAWVIAPLAHQLVSGHRSVDEFLVLDVKKPARWPAFVRELRERRFDLAIDLQRISKSAFVTRATGARTRLGFDRARCKEASYWATNARIPPNAAPGVTVEQYLEFADFLELPSGAPRFDLPYETVDPKLAGETRAVVQIGASKPANRWSAAQWSELVRRLVTELGVTVHVSGGREDRAAASEVAELAGVPLVDRTGALTLKQTAGLLRTADVFVGGDTGPLHMAVAVGTPVVALFGAADPRRTGPFGQSAWVVSRPTPCSPCRKRDCFVEGHPCMALLEVATVFERVRRRLAPQG